MRVLLIQLRQLGDILLTTPCIRAIKQAIPQCEVYFLCHRMGQSLLEGNPYLDGTFLYHQNDRWPQHLQLIRDMRRMKFDAAIDFMNNPRSAWLARASGAQRRIAFRSARRLFYSETVDKPKDGGYIVSEKFLLVERLLQKAKSETPSLLSETPSNLQLDFQTQTSESIQNFLAQVQKTKPSRKIVALSPTHRRAARVWPMENFATLADRLVENFEVSVVWLWGPGEETYVRACQTLCRQPTHLAPTTNLNELGSLIQACDLFIAGSNGPSHIAVAVGTPSVQLHGPTKASAWCPPTPLHRSIQAKERDMHAISTKEVYEVAAGMLSRDRSAWASMS